MNLLDTVEESLKTFRPKTHRQFVAFSIASRFDDLPNIARYLNVCHHSARHLLEAARLAEETALRHGANRTNTFFDLLIERDRKETA